MFMYEKKTNPSHHTAARVACVILAALTIAVALWGVLPVDAETTASWTADRSGDVCIPAGDASLPSAPAGISARGAVLVEADSGEVIWGQNAHTRLPMASTTKIMTALVALEQMSPQTEVTIPAEAVGVEGSSVYLVEGEILTLEQLLYALLLESANDAAAAIAVAVAGSVEEFAALMNRKAAELGLTDTHFVNPHGLDHDEHYTTAYELATITRAALENPAFREICATRRKTIPLHGGSAEEGARLLLNHNKLLSAYDGCIGVKTGFTKRTGRCLVSAAERDGVTLIAVTLNAPDDWRDHTTLLDYGFALYESVELCPEGFYHAPLWLVAGEQNYGIAESTAPLIAVLRRDHGDISCVVELPRFEFAPIRFGQTVGALVFFESRPDGSRRELGRVPLTAAYGVNAVTYKPTLRDRITALFE